MPESTTCEFCGEPLEEGWYSPGLHSPDRHLRYCCSAHRADAYRLSHLEATDEDVFLETVAEQFHRPDPPASRPW